MEIYEFGQRLIKEAGEFVRQRMLEDFRVDSKLNPNDLVTDVDRETETFIYDRINEMYPDHHIIGEEGHGTEIDDASGVLWIVDPIDGTLNFVHQLQNFAISIGVYIDGEKHCGLILDVMNDTLYHAQSGKGAYMDDRRLEPIGSTELATSLVSLNPNWVIKERIGSAFAGVVKDARSTRSYGSAALDLAYTATGIVSATLFFRLHPWDYAAGMIIIDEVGGRTTNLLGEEIDILHKDSILAGNRALHGELVQYFADDEAFIEAHRHVHGEKK
ncbi:inositol monophosphatase family protein [Salinicoccus sp. ID82-1]|uniref:inositol-phosphate phosphatase n=1 Tax=Salinicoccus cyprini TaxID=2493691 RepID=A0A558AXU1_9STAP|nr:MULTISPECIES: inositol monophosphatase family protein [Salinicoccus]MCG1008604.1 inositol monophosphatase family protein [Salinicoccus sp. ID82-1]TVT29082.1 inositol monophosphatase family protein [Salinicoccus cyprini]